MAAKVERPAILTAVLTRWAGAVADDRPLLSVALPISAFSTCFQRPTPTGRRPVDDVATERMPSVVTGKNKVTTSRVGPDVRYISE